MSNFSFYRLKQLGIKIVEGRIIIKITNISTQAVAAAIRYMKIGVQI